MNCRVCRILVSVNTNLESSILCSYNSQAIVCDLVSLNSAYFVMSLIYLLVLCQMNDCRYLYWQDITMLKLKYRSMAHVFLNSQIIKCINKLQCVASILTLVRPATLALKTITLLEICKKCHVSV